MTRPGPPRRWDPLRPLDVLAAFWSTAAVVNSGAAAAYRTLFLTLRRLVVGRRLAVRLADGDLVLTITEFDSRLDLRGLAVGQLNDVRLEATDLSWNGLSFDTASAVLQNVHVRASVPPVLVAAPVELTLELPAPVLDELFRWAAPRLSGEIGDDGVARISLARRKGSGHVEVDTHIDGSTLWITPRAIVRRRRWALPQNTPAYRVRLPELPRGLQLTDVDLAPGVVKLTGTLPQWHMDVPRARLEDVINQLSAVGRPLSLIWPTRG